ncbi:MAG TPA: extracellular solute-binding protein, partial [Dehalococcoidia bacterium]|nr:extracellular solute-binding protein [Dehalococcoidia bacterium]
MILFVIVLALVTLLACGSGDAGDGQVSAGSLVIYSGRSESLVGPIITQFAEASGIDVRVKYGGTAELAATIREEGNNTPADVFFAQDPGGLGAVASMLSPLPPDIISAVPDWARAANSADWVGISGRARVVVYNRNAISESDLPSDLQDLTDPRWKGRIGWAPANASFQTMVTAMRSTWGEDETRKFLTGLKSNDPQEYPKNTPIVAATAAGEIDVGLVNHYYLHRFIQEDGEDFAARNHFLRDNGPGSLIMVSGAGILNEADNRDNAEKF